MLGAIQSLKKPTVTSIASRLGFAKSTVQMILENLNSDQYPCTEILIKDAVCSVQNWGISNLEIIEDFYLNYL